MTDQSSKTLPNKKYHIRSINLLKVSVCGFRFRLMATLEGRLEDTISRDERTGIQHRMVRGFFSIV